MAAKKEGEQAIVLRVSTEMHQALVRLAADEKRSLNSQIVKMLEDALKETKR